jgi:hypothetical protein
MKRFVLTTIALLALLMLTVGCEREVTGDVQVVNQADENCFECHNGRLDQAQGEWANSVHASGSSVDYTNRGGSDCTACHNQEGFISFLTTGQLPSEPLDQVSAIGCFSCHNPHENGDLSLRISDPYVLANGVVFDYNQGNLCVECHHSRESVAQITDNFEITSSRFGPHHGPQGDMLAGTQGYEFPGLDYDIFFTPHANAVRDACAGCHMGNVSNHDGYAVGGHTFRIVSEDGAESQIEFCADAGCHGADDPDSINFTVDAVDYDGDGNVEGFQSEIAGMLEELETLLRAQGIMVTGGRNDGLLQTGTYADGHLVGAAWNFYFVEDDQSHGGHNFRYAVSLLEASIDYVSSLPPPAAGSNLATIPSH